MQSLFTLGKLEGSTPDYTTLCRRQSTLTFKLAQLSRRIDRSKPVDLVIDSTGLKVFGEGEWCVKKHGQHYQRTWRKIHLGVDAQTLEILSCRVTNSRVQDSAVLEALLSDIESPLSTVIGDGAYDTFPCYQSVEQRGARALFPPNARARLSSETPRYKKEASREAIAQRDAAIQGVRTLGKSAWKKAVGYHQRSLAETSMYRLKRLGSSLSAKNRSNQILEVRARCHILNIMNNLGKSPNPDF